MKCAVHPDLDATGFCRNCGKPLCPGCTREVRGALYCEPCLASLVAPPALPAAQGAAAVPVAPAGAVHPAGANAGVALALGFIPGLGAVYNGEYAKALIHVFVFAGLIAAQTRDISAGYHAFLGIALGVFCLYMPIEAYHVAKARLMGVAPPEPFGVGPESQTGERRPVGAIVLIAIGAFFLLANLGMLEWDWFGRVWPLGLIALGVWLLADRFKKNA
ncbi:MAG TPA: B-box zinc finger protein [Candidatus Aquilonibacter sp.]|nr:B-box zinc finger protein [Candidatus Aquilonibacter sp.]